MSSASLEKEEIPTVVPANPVLSVKVEEPRLEPSLLEVYPVTFFWICMSCAVILFNKYLYSGTFSYPVTLTVLHMGFATCATQVLRLAGALEVPNLGVEFYASKVVPIGILFSLSLALSNLAAVRLSVSFMQMVKALTPILTLGVTIVLGMERGTKTLFLVVCVMCVGVLVASYGEIRFDTLGLILQVASIAAEAGRLVVTQALLHNHLPKSSPLVSVALFAPCALFFLLPLSFYLEPGAISVIPNVLSILTLNTLTAFTLNVSVVMLVAKTSGLTLTLAGIVKDIALIAASVIIFRSPLTYLQVSWLLRAQPQARSGRHTPHSKIKNGMASPPPPFSQVGGYSVALFGLNLYNGYRESVKGGNEPTGIVELARQAVYGKATLAMCIGVGSLLLIAQHG